MDFKERWENVTFGRVHTASLLTIAPLFELKNKNFTV